MLRSSYVYHSSTCWVHFSPRHQQGLIIDVIELLSTILSLAAWGAEVTDSVLLVASGDTKAISWMAEKRSKKGIAHRPLGTFQKWVIDRDLVCVGVYARNYHNASADALARTSAEQIELRMGVRIFPDRVTRYLDGILRVGECTSGGR